MRASEAELKDQLLEVVRGSSWFMDALATVRELDLADWCIGAGAIRNLVWDTLHGKHPPSKLADVDVAYFDLTDVSPQRDYELQRRLLELRPSVPWEVTN